MKTLVEYQQSFKNETEDYAKLKCSLHKFYGFKTGELLGKGAFGEVRKAFYAKENCEIAVKILKKKNFSNTNDQFLRNEIEIIKLLYHKNIIKFLKCIETNKTVYIFMEFAQDCDLHTYVKKYRYIDEENACRWFHHLVEGVEYCHSKNIAHRDLKCQNLLICKNKVLKISDFGLACQIITSNEYTNCSDNKHLSTTFCGTLNYACPEILCRIPYYPDEADIWCMGIILYVMIVGKIPYKGKNACSMIIKMARPIIFPHRPKSIISQSCISLIKKILKPMEDRINIQDIKNDPWYQNTWDIRWELVKKNTLKNIF
ncbi:testis-specific serine/threonine-protein kinase 4-like [Centruroides vittatus]|uniref:testis-specific serine/threonine-protein kinase 4-like n=1 Tax=Centruroides vittatus TaxID=120091 RepID=UPI00350EA311